jgi:hypothetical protein
MRIFQLPSFTAQSDSASIQFESEGRYVVYNGAESATTTTTERRWRWV